MPNSFLPVALRRFTRRKGYTVLNLLGLTMGMASCLLIFAYVAFERSFDNFHPHADRIFRVQESDQQNSGLVVNWATTSPAVGPTLKKEFPEVETVCRLIQYELLLSNDARHIKTYEYQSYAADTTVLSMLLPPLVKGDRATALRGMNKVVLSEVTARKYFGAVNPIGKTLTVRNDGGLRNLEVTGVFKSLPANSHLVLDILISYPTYSDIVGRYGSPNDPTETSWSWTDFYTYIELRPGADRQVFEAKLPAFIARHYNDLPKHKSLKDAKALTLYPLTAIHLYSHATGEAAANGDGSSVSFLFLIALVIAGMAWINALNLATVRSLENAREAGVRKVLGARRADLVRQSMVEALLLNTTALPLALALTWITNPLFNQLTGRSIATLPLHYVELFAVLFLGGTLLSGFYPALVLSRFDPATALRGGFKHSPRGQWLRKGLIVGQFVASFLLIAGTLVARDQLRYMRSRQLGAHIGETLILAGIQSMNDSTYASLFPAFKAAMLQIGGVKDITGSSNVMGQEISWSAGWQRLDSTVKTNTTLQHLGVDYDFIPHYRLTILAGRAFSNKFGTDKNAVLLNESAVKAFGYAHPSDAIGAWLHASQRGIDTVHVIGVVADYHHEGLQQAIRPMALLLRSTPPAYYSVGLAAANIPQTLTAIKKVWDSLFPADPFDYFFLDAYFDRQYGENERFATVFGLFAGLAILIACLGLLALSAYNVSQRTKEIGIRKVLGASVGHLLYILSRDFLLLVALSFVIAVPVTAWTMDNWLRAFAYRIDIGWWIFAIAGALAFSIALLTVGILALKAILANPVGNLRME